MRWGWLIGLMAVAWALLATAQQDVAPDDPVVNPKTAQARLERAAASIDQARYADALPDLEAVFKSGQMQSPQDDWAHYLRARALLGTGRGGDAESDVRAYFIAKPSAYAFRSQVTILAMRERWVPAAQSLLELSDPQFAFANSVASQVVGTILSGLARDGDLALRAKLLGRLVSVGYIGNYGGKTPDELRLLYLDQLLSEGQLAAAAAQTKYFETPSVFVALLTDRAYEKLWTSAEFAALTPTEMQLRVRARAAALISRGIRHGGEGLEAVRAYRAAGDPNKAIETATKSIQQISSKPSARRYVRLIQIEKAYALADLGKAKDVAAIFETMLKQYVDDPVAVRLAYARVMEAAGEGAKALSVLEPLDPDALSIPARASALQTSICASSTAGNTKVGDDALRELKDMGLNAGPALLEANLCRRDDEAAKSLLVSWLSTPALRRSAIAALQLYAEPQTVLPSLLDRRRRLNALISRADVQSALQPFGRTMGWGFQRAMAVSY